MVDFYHLFGKGDIRVLQTSIVRFVMIMILSKTITGISVNLNRKEVSKVSQVFNAF